jgi:ATP-dependent helicase/nuclease subunit B
VLLRKMVEHFGNPDTPYLALPWPEFGPYFNDYEHLERVAEWSTVGGGNE